MRLKSENACKSVGALLRREDAVTEAESLGVVDWATTDPERALCNADIVIFATPVRVLIKQLAQYERFLKPGAVVTDLGSTKRKITQSMHNMRPDIYSIGSHPMCGKEVAGIAVAEASLYENATWVVSPMPDTPSGVISLIESLARTVGAKPINLAPDRHDQLVAAISHMPYTLSAALVLTAKAAAEQDNAVWAVAASGFRDTSRIAASDVSMMMDILLTNQDAVTTLIAQFRQQLDRIASAITRDDETELRRLLEEAKDQRQSLYP